MRPLIVSCIVVLSLGLAVHASGSDGGSTSSVSNLPLVAQSSISTALGRDNTDYYMHPVNGGFLARNSHQNLTARFTTDGVEVSDGTARLRMKLRGYGYGGAFKIVRPTAPQACMNRVEYRHGAFTEWHVNGPAGLEQGFNIATRPSRSDGQPLTITLMLSGDFAATIRSDDREFAAVSPDGRTRVRYTGLRAYDANGTELNATVEVRGDLLRLKVVDKGALYPLVVDPIIQLAEITASDGATNDLFGLSTAVSGNTVVVGAFNATIKGVIGRGAAYVFIKPPSGWKHIKQVAKLTTSDGGYDELGISVAISGKTIVAGASGANFNSGAAYVFVRPASGWVDMTETAKLTPSDATGDDLFGASVSIDGDTVVVGAQRNSPSLYAQGAAYVFVKPAGGWVSMTQTAKLLPSDPFYDGEFGNAVQIKRNTIVVGEHYKNLAYVFVKPTNGWTNMAQTAELSATDSGLFDQFGFSVATTGNVVVVGSPSATDPGEAYIFVEPPGGWQNMTQTAELSASDGTPTDYFGSAVAINAKMVLVGAETAPIGTNFGQGAAYLFVKPKSGWKTTSKFYQKLTATNGAVESLFGASVAMASGTFLVGAPYTRVGSNATQGAVYEFIWKHPSDDQSDENILDPF
jgi:hypothetical protein